MSDTTESLQSGVPQGSFLGVASLGLAVLSVSVCAVAAAFALTGTPSAMFVVFAMPLVGFAAVIVGGAALVKRRALMRRDGGVVGGAKDVPLQRGPAMFGIIIGLASAVLQGSVLAGAVMSYVPVKRALVPVVEAMLTEVGAGHPDRAMVAIADASKSVVDAPRLDGFFRAAVGVVGEPARAHVGIDIFLKSRTVLSDAVRTGGGQGPAPDLLMQVKALEIVGPKNRVVMYVLLDEDALKLDRVRIADAMIALEDGECVVLLPQGRMSQLAGYLGFEIVNGAPVD